MDRDAILKALGIPEDIAEAYPRACVAIQLHEEVTQLYGDGGLWEAARAKCLPPQKMREILLKTLPTLMEDSTKSQLEFMLHQMNTDDFLKYVAAKLGAF